MGDPRRRSLAVLMMGLLALAVLDRPAGDPDAGRFEACCSEARLVNGWCDVHQRGYVAGLEIRSRVLHDALDAHGHTLDPELMGCATCKALVEPGGFCEGCRTGWVGGQAYFTRLTYHLALGEPTVDDARCDACRADGAPSGWCATCAGGWAGNVRFERHEDQAAAARELEHLLVVRETAARCETCALVQLVGNGRCPYCSITFAGGRPVER